MNQTTPQALRSTMAEFLGGSDTRYRHPFNRLFLYSEGVKTVAVTAGAFWLLDLIALGAAKVCMDLWKTREIPLFTFKLSVRNSQALAYVPNDIGNQYQDSDEKEAAAPIPHLWERRVDYTDFPEGEWTFMLGMDGLIEPGKEVLVMYLLEEH